MPTSQPPRIIFWGTPEFSVPFLKALINTDLKPILAVTQPDKPIGRKKAPVPPPIKKTALENDIPIFQPKKSEDLENIFEKYNPDVCVLVAFGMIISEKYLNKPKHGWLNVHPSLLPKYRGSSPIQTALLNTDKQTGITIIRLAPKVDAGPIVAQKIIDINPDDNAEILHNRLADIGSELLAEILPDYLDGKINPESQDDSKSSFTKMINREDGKIDWQKNAKRIKQQFKAFFPWPGVFTHLNKKRLKITDLGVLEDKFSLDLSLGELFLGLNKELAVKCGNGAIILKKVQLEGKKEMSGEEFLRGQKELPGQVLR